MAARHVPVLYKEVLDYACCRNGDVFVDATLGSAGHSLGLLERYGGIGRLIGIDCDQAGLERARVTLEPFKKKVTLLHGNFRHLTRLLEREGIAAIGGIMFDFGVSTPQLKDPARGFGFSNDGALDMRMDTSMPQTALDLVKRLSARELEDIIRVYGEERFARRIASAVKEAAARNGNLSTGGLADTVFRAIPARFHPDRLHPATRTFQALRIAVNDELEAIKEGLDQALELLTPGGRLLAISFHSLEDRIVKNRFRDWEKKCHCPAGLPVCVCGGTQRIKVLTRKPVYAADEEVTRNPSSRSARLRVAERLH
ncbi:MAG: 16S rRNA (cytosine(1402)-N(4))-methyltransferase RsmH [Deltaproteobacteria bacterium]|nr:16S rRNA (cytosine(1402)-N(4))-methyltransferase RsmH [Deltaproteobacteria bacterium]